MTGSVTNADLRSLGPHECDHHRSARPARSRTRAVRVAGCCANTAPVRRRPASVRIARVGRVRTLPGSASIAQEVRKLAYSACTLKGYGCQGANPSQYGLGQCRDRGVLIRGLRSLGACRVPWRCTRSTPTAARSRSSAGCRAWPPASSHRLLPSHHRTRSGSTRGRCVPARYVTVFGLGAHRNQGVDHEWLAGRRRSGVGAHR